MPQHRSFSYVELLFGVFFLSRLSRGKLLEKFSPHPFQNFHRGGIGYPPRVGGQNSTRFCSVGESFVCANMVLPRYGSHNLFLHLTVLRNRSRKFWGPLPLKLTADTGRQAPKFAQTRRGNGIITINPSAVARAHPCQRRITSQKRSHTLAVDIPSPGEGQRERACTS